MEALLLSPAVLFGVFVFGIHLVGDAVAYDVVNDAGQLMRRRRDRFRGGSQKPERREPCLSQTLYL